MSILRTYDDFIVVAYTGGSRYTKYIYIYSVNYRCVVSSWWCPIITTYPLMWSMYMSIVDSRDCWLYYWLASLHNKTGFHRFGNMPYKRSIRACTVTWSVFPMRTVTWSAFPNSLRATCHIFFHKRSQMCMQSTYAGHRRHASPIYRAHL